MRAPSQRQAASCVGTTGPGRRAVPPAGGGSAAGEASRRAAGNMQGLVVHERLLQRNSSARDAQGARADGWQTAHGVSDTAERTVPLTAPVNCSAAPRSASKAGFQELHLHGAGRPHLSLAGVLSYCTQPHISLLHAALHPADRLPPSTATRLQAATQPPQQRSSDSGHAPEVVEKAQQRSGEPRRPPCLPLLAAACSRPGCGSKHSAWQLAAVAASRRCLGVRL